MRGGPGRRWERAADRQGVALGAEAPLARAHAALEADLAVLDRLVAVVAEELELRLAADRAGRVRGALERAPLPRPRGGVARRQ